jgi:hypothetical protein
MYMLSAKFSSSFTDVTQSRLRWRTNQPFDVLWFELFSLWSHGRREVSAERFVAYKLIDGLLQHAEFLTAVIPKSRSELALDPVEVYLIHTKDLHRKE